MAIHKPRLVIIEDEDLLRQNMVTYLTKRGYAARGMASAEEFLTMPQTENFDIAIIDLILPGMDGFALCRELRQSGPIGIIMLSGVLTESENRVHGLRLGADYYLTKPVNLVELTATIDSLFSRMNRFSDNSSKIPGLWLLEPALRQLVAPDGQSVRLTASELGFLSAVMQQAGKLVTRQAIIEAMGENPADYDLCRMDTLVRRLRLKIKERLAPLPLETVHGQGYIFTAQAKLP